MGSPEELRKPLGENALENRERPLEGKVALITGSGRDIGAGIATALALEGVAVIGNYREKAKRADALQASLSSKGAKTEFVQADITVPEDREKLQGALQESFGGKLDWLILNASGPTRDINVIANNALVTELLPYINTGGKIILMQSIGGHYQRQLEGLDKIPHFYEPVAEAKHEGEQILRSRIPEFQQRGVSFFVVCPPEVEDTSNMMVFKRGDPLVSEKHAEISDMLGIPRTVSIKDVGEKVVELLKREDLPMGYVELFSDVLDARSVLSEWYGDNAIFVDTLEMTSVDQGVGRMVVAKDYTKGHFNERVGQEILPGHVMIEAAAQTLGLIALRGKADNNTMPMFQEVSAKFLKAARPGDGLRIYGEVTERTRRGFAGNVNIANMRDEMVAEIMGIKALVVDKNIAMRLLRG